MRYSANLCPRYQHAMGLLGKRWTGLIVTVLLEGPARFNELGETLQVVADRVLAERLRELEAEGILTRHVFAESPVRVEYRLTQKGQALAPIVRAIEDWSHQWLPTDSATRDSVPMGVAPADTDE